MKRFGFLTVKRRFTCTRSLRFSPKDEYSFLLHIMYLVISLTDICAEIKQNLTVGSFHFYSSERKKQLQKRFRIIFRILIRVEATIGRKTRLRVFLRIDIRKTKTKPVPRLCSVNLLHRCIRVTFKTIRRPCTPTFDRLARRDVDRDTFSRQVITAKLRRYKERKYQQR